MLRNQLKTQLKLSDFRVMETDALQALTAEIDSFLEDCQFYARSPRYMWNVLDNRENMQKVIAERA